LSQDFIHKGQSARADVGDRAGEFRYDRRLKLTHNDTRKTQVDIVGHWLDHNPHAHILLTTRSLNLEAGQFGQKNGDWNGKDLLNAQCKAWAVYVNAALAKDGRGILLSR
jgi:hypothetical protein